MILPPYYNKILIFKLVNEGIMLILALCVGVKNLRKNGGIKISDSLDNLLVRDAIYHFVV